MKINTLVLLALVLLPAAALSQLRTYNQYFDGNDTLASNSIIIHMDTANNLWQVGPPQKIIFDSAATQPNAIVTDTANLYPPNDTSRFYYGISPSQFGFGILALQWKQKLDMERGHAGGIIEFSRDTGRTWENAFQNPYVYNFYGYEPENEDTLANGEIAFTGTDSTWKDIWLCFDISWLLGNGSDTLLIRHTFVSDTSSNRGEGWIIDNMIAHLTFVHTVNEFEKDEYMKVFPNPTSGKVDIETRKHTGLHIIEEMELINAGGEVLQRWDRSPTKFSINIGHHPAGTYLLRVKTNLHTETFRILLTAG